MNAILVLIAIYFFMKYRKAKRQTSGRAAGMSRDRAFRGRVGNFNTSIRTFRNIGWLWRFIK